jgi:hypothetical protein
VDSFTALDTGLVEASAGKRRPDRSCLARPDFQARVRAARRATRSGMMAEKLRPGAGATGAATPAADDRNGIGDGIPLKASILARSAWSGSGALARHQPTETGKGQLMRVVLGAALLLSGGAAAAEGWSFAITPYLWVSGIDSTIPTPLGAVDTSARFGDIIDNLDFAAMGTIEARKGRLGAKVDAIHLAVSTENETPQGIPFEQADARLKSWIVTGAGTWRGFETDKVAIDLTAGFRFMRIGTALDLTGGLGPDRSFDRSGSWVDPVFGTVVTWQMAEGWYARGSGDVGGFGVSSDITFQGLVALGYRFSNRVSAEAAYRHLEVERTGDGGDFRVAIKGPQLGVRIGF